MPIKYFCDVCGKEVEKDEHFEVHVSFFDSANIITRHLLSEDIILCENDAQKFANKLVNFIEKSLKI